ncbi:MAG: hypothetical protein R2724_19460 [Bryobacterales bacterium]
MRRKSETIAGVTQQLLAGRNHFFELDRQPRVGVEGLRSLLQSHKRYEQPLDRVVGEELRQPSGSRRVSSSTITSSPPEPRVEKISCALTSKLNDANCNVRSPGWG